MNFKYMELAYQEALIAKECNEVPVGAVIVCDDALISSAHNQKMSTNNACNHAEILAINEASNKLNDWRLSNCAMYVTLEPCPMCAGAIMQSRIKKIYIGAHANSSNNTEIINNIFNNSEFHHRVICEYVDDEKCSLILTNFFSNVREKK